MWRKQEPKPFSPAEEPVQSPPTYGETPPPETVRLPGRAPVEGTHVSKTLRIKGEVSGREDLYIDGEMEGTIRLTGARVTVGPAGRVKAEIEAGEIEVHGQVQGTLRGLERVRIGRSGKLTGDVVTHRIAIEDGAVMRGRVDIVKPGEARAPKVREAAVSAGHSGDGAGAVTREPVN